MAVTYILVLKNISWTLYQGGKKSLKKSPSNTEDDNNNKLAFQKCIKITRNHAVSHRVQVKSRFKFRAGINKNLVHYTNKHERKNKILGLRSSDCQKSTENKAPGKPQRKKTNCCNGSHNSSALIYRFISDTWNRYDWSNCLKSDVWLNFIPLCSAQQASRKWLWVSMRSLCCSLTPYYLLYYVLVRQQTHYNLSVPIYPAWKGGHISLWNYNTDNHTENLNSTENPWKSMKLHQNFNTKEIYTERTLKITLKICLCYSSIDPCTLLITQKNC